MAQAPVKKRSTPSPPGRPVRPAPIVPRAPVDWRTVALLPALILIVAAAYYPAWHGGVLWDDPGHITRFELRSLGGLWRIWFDLGATQQYYPVVHSVFWVMARLFGDNTLAYHLLNITLHGGSAFLLVIILRRLAVPGAVLAGVIFALHPLQVESVAWMTELKNTLSGMLYLGAALAYLRFDQRRERGAYALAMTLFVLALFSKTVTATLPAGLLVVFWWQRGRLDWRKDVLPLLPFFAIGAAGGAMTAWVERTYIGAEGAVFDLTFIERVLVAGRAVAFYLGKLLWPADLIFMYPRWNVSAAVWWQFLYPALVGLTLAALWFFRSRSRAPLASLLFFGVTLSPALGFVNVYPFKFSFVADHFQYLACIGVIAFAAAALVSAAARWHIGSKRIVESVLILAIGAPLFFLTRAQTRQYVNEDTLWRVTIDRNPMSWLAENNLGILELHGSAADRDDAFERFQIALKIDPKEPLVRNNIGVALRERGRLDEALLHHQEAVRLAPNYAEAYANLGADLQLVGRYEEAVSAFRRALDIKPELVATHSQLGIVLEKLGRKDEAMKEFTGALTLNPSTADDHIALGAAFLRVGRTADAVSQYQEALRVDPLSARIRGDLGYALWRAGRLDEAATALQETIRAQPENAAARDNLGNVLQSQQRLDEAVVQYNAALAVSAEVNRAEILNDLGVALARLGRRDQAIAHFQESLALKPEFADARANLARALAMPK